MYFAILFISKLCHELIGMGSERYIPPIDRYSVVLASDDLRRMSRSGDRVEKHADYYIHFEDRYRCAYVVIEVEGSKVGRALKQLESTVERLRREMVRGWIGL